MEGFLTDVCMQLLDKSTPLGILCIVFLIVTAILAVQKLSRQRLEENLWQKQEILEKHKDIKVKYGLSASGFLPLSCVERLPSYYEEWEQIVDNLPNLNKSRKFHDAIDEMKLLSCRYLENEGMLHRAFIILGMMVHSHVNGDDVPWEVLAENNGHPTAAFNDKRSENRETLKKLPSQLSIPWFTVCQKLDLPFILTAGLDLWNWKLKDPNKPIKLGNLSTISSMTGTDAEIYFHMVPCAMQAVAGPFMPRLFTFHEILSSGNKTILVQFINDVTKIFKEFKLIIKEIRKLVDKDLFYDVYRPLLAGFWPNGIMLQLHDNHYEKSKFREFGDETEVNATMKAKVDGNTENEVFGTQNGLFTTNCDVNTSKAVPQPETEDNATMKEKFDGSTENEVFGTQNGLFATNWDTNCDVDTPKTVPQPETEDNATMKEKFDGSTKNEVFGTQNGLFAGNWDKNWELDVISTVAQQEIHRTFSSEGRCYSVIIDKLQNGDILVNPKGPSAGQSTMIILFDLLLGIQHWGTGKEFQTEMLDYMPRKHRQMAIDFREFVLEKGSLRDAVLNSGSKTAVLAFNECIDSVAEFRALHLGIAMKYLARTSLGTGSSSFKSMLDEMLKGTKSALIH